MKNEHFIMSFIKRNNLELGTPFNVFIDGDEVSVMIDKYGAIHPYFEYDKEDTMNEETKKIFYFNLLFNDTWIVKQKLFTPIPCQRYFYIDIFDSKVKERINELTDLDKYNLKLNNCFVSRTYAEANVKTMLKKLLLFK